ncbi:hypothetical protein M0D21_10835 [Aquimarina sp. D1M17]|uniref:hypothetical protein n=1 Tax=Aquimarina acroporae TaxID=2937283 RepID=UPI0020C156D4|nr:hypothetical protein [Aquimarina acroporae]MCK8522066.1 hypothetical protein [Aquimarina acroporae]
MGNAITQNNEKLDPAAYPPTREKWCEEDVLQLAHHFHKLNRGQYQRVTYFKLNPSELKRFNKFSERIASIRIYLALEQKYRKEKVSFCPYLHLNYDEKDTPESQGEKIFYLTPCLEPRPNESRFNRKQFTESLVPKIFKEKICANWDKVEMHLIDDLFHCWGEAKSEEGNMLGTMLRVEFFMLDEIVQDIIPEKVEAIHLYPGIDMNKFQHEDEISFTPVLGVTPPLHLNREMSGVGLMESNDDETYLEYSKPCPPTCP